MCILVILFKIGFIKMLLMYFINTCVPFFLTLFVWSNFVSRHCSQSHLRRLFCLICHIISTPTNLSFVFLENSSARMVAVLLVQLNSNLILNFLKNTQQIYAVIWRILYYFVNCFVHISYIRRRNSLAL